MVDQDDTPTTPAPAGLESVERDGLDYAQYEESARPPDAIGIDPEDGLPRPFPAAAIEDNFAPSLTIERFVCMADTREFVMRDEWGEVLQRFLPSDVERAPNGQYRVRGGLIDPATVARRSRGASSESVDKRASRIKRASQYINEHSEALFVVDPVRHQCKHYVRQLVPFAGDESHSTCYRYCTALKNESGEFLSVGNQEVLACELRDPRDPTTEQELDDFDRRLIQLGTKPRQEDEEFDIEAALRRERKEGTLGVLGG